MSGNLTTDIRYLLVTQMALLIALLTCNVNVTHRGRVHVILDELAEASDDVFESAARDEEVVIVFGVEECAQCGENYCADVQIPDSWSALDYLSNKCY